MPDLTKERADFEAWFDAFRHGWKSERDVAWAAWQARAALSTPAVQGEAQDAARYRWLASRCARTGEHWGGQWAIFLSGPGPSEPSSREAVDAAIDAAMQAQGEQHD